MKKLLPLAILLAFSACKTVQKTTSKNTPTEPILMYVGDLPVTVSEFKYVYEKNNPNPDSLYKEKSLQEYLELYTKFKLKVLDAHKKGVDTTAEFKMEYLGYENQLARPYLITKETTDNLVKETYNRLQEEVNASHILIKVANEADPKDTLFAYNKIKSIREKALKGDDFSALARQYSEDPSANINGGNLGYFTALQMVYPFESAAYNTPKGQISEIIRSEFGYHILKVLDRRQSSGKVTAAHIMLKTPKGMSVQDSIGVRQRIFEIHQRAKSGEDFATLVRQFSEDANTKNNGGQLREFGVGDILPEFENATFALKNIGDISEPVKTAYGWHIIKLIARTPRETFEQAEATIKMRVQRDSRSEVSKNATLVRLRKENNLKVNQKNLQKALKGVDTTLLKGNWSYTDNKMLKSVLATLESPLVGKKRTITINDFYFHLKNQQKPRPDLQDPQFYASLLWQRYLDDELVNFEKNILSEKYKDYKMLIQEYREGMMLFAMMNENVWGKALKDTTGAKKFYESHKNNYQWGERAFATIFDAADEATLKKIEGYLNEKAPYLLNNYFKNPILTYKKDILRLEDKANTDLLNQIANDLNNDKSLLLEISGFMDKNERPKTLSADRAKVIFDHLYGRGINPNQVIRKDFGSSMPGTKKKPKPNSRVELQMYAYSLKPIERQINLEKPLSLQITEIRPYEKGTSPLLSQVPWQEGKHKLKQNGRDILVQINSIEKPRAKNFEEAKGQIISDYQVYLENEWVESLRKLYPVKVEQTELQKLIKP